MNEIYRVVLFLLHIGILLQNQKTYIDCHEFRNCDGLSSERRNIVGNGKRNQYLQQYRCMIEISRAMLFLLHIGILLKKQKTYPDYHAFGNYQTLSSKRINTLGNAKRKCYLQQYFICKNLEEASFHGVLKSLGNLIHFIQESMPTTIGFEPFLFIAPSRVLNPSLTL